MPPQIRRHLLGSEQDSAEKSQGENIVLIGLTKEPIAENDRKSLAAEAALKGITFAAVAVSQIVETLRAVCGNFDRDGGPSRTNTERG